MTSQSTTLALVLALLTVTACEDAVGPSPAGIPRLTTAESRHTVIVNPNAQGDGIARTIQEGIDRVASGGRVLVKPGTYDERIMIDKGLTLEPIGEGDGFVIIRPLLAAPAPNGLQAAISVATREPVVLRNLQLRHENIRGLNVLFTAADLTLERMSIEGRWSSAPPILNNGVSVVNNAAQSGGRARLVVRDSRISVDGNAVSLGGDIDAVIERNAFLHEASNAGCVFVSPVGQGVTVPAGAQTNVEILDNLFDDCGANLPDGSKGVAPVVVLGTLGATTTGTVNIVGNTFRTRARTAASCNTTGITYEFFTGRIEGNSLIGVVHDCATPAGRSLPAAIFVGSRVAGMRGALVSVRFNDITGNSHAGLRLGSNQATTIDATCNWWGDVTGPSGLGSGSGDRIVREAGGADPIFTPFATAPMEGRAETSC